jgi:O-phospho-L-seryl-tRNASec:L-selenocysteinyl-tRNA synthase
MPKTPFDDLTIDHLMNRIALMDSNNYANNAGVGEREGRIYSSIVKHKNFNLGHGIGRSGDVNALQPKAIGSSLIVKLLKAMTINILNKVVGLPLIKDAIILPLATGMALTMTLLAIKADNPELEYVVMPRID